MKRFGLVAALLALSLGAGSALAAEPVQNGADAQVAKGFQQWEAGRIDDARQSFELAIKKDPRSIDAHMKLGGLLLSSLHFQEAINVYKETLALDANNAKAWIGLGFAYRHVGEPELARAAFGEAVRIDPSRGESLSALTAKGGEGSAPK